MSEHLPFSTHCTLTRKSNDGGKPCFYTDHSIKFASERIRGINPELRRKPEARLFDLKLSQGISVCSDFKMSTVAQIEPNRR